MTPDGIVYYSCHGKYLLEVKCPYKCCNRELRDAAVNDPSFFLKGNDGVLALDTAHAYYYQVQCQLSISEVEMFFCCVDSRNCAYRGNPSRCIIF